MNTSNRTKHVASTLFMGAVAKKLQYEYTYQQKMDKRIFRHILNDYILCRQRNLLSVSSHWDHEVARWLNRVGGMAGEW